MEASGNLRPAGPGTGVGRAMPGDEYPKNEEKELTYLEKSIS
jgi:hypothetical protein